MNRRKKIYTKLKAKDKKANQKLNPKKKPKYISKADRAKLEAEPIPATTSKEEACADKSPENN